MTSSAFRKEAPSTQQTFRHRLDAAIQAQLAMLDSPALQNSMTPEAIESTREEWTSGFQTIQKQVGDNYSAFQKLLHDVVKAKKPTSVQLCVKMLATQLTR